MEHPLFEGQVLAARTTSTQAVVVVVAVGVVCPVTFAMHLARAVETPRKDVINRPCVVIAGGREPTHRESYPTHKYLHHVGALECCEQGGCWRSRAFELGDGDDKDKSLCTKPIDLNTKIKTPQGKDIDLKIPKCLDMITHKHVIEAIESYYEGGVVQYGEGWNGVQSKLNKDKPSENKPIDI